MKFGVSSMIDPRLDPEDEERLLRMDKEQYEEFAAKAHEALAHLIQRTTPDESLPVGYHGRWDMLSVEDVKFLIRCGIAID